MRTASIVLILISSALAACNTVRATGNAMGGTVPRTPETQQQALDAAGEHCLQYGKRARTKDDNKPGSANEIRFECF